MQHLEVSGAVRPLKWSLCVKCLTTCDRRLQYKGEGKVTPYLVSVVYVNSEGEISCILDPHIGQNVWSASHSGSLAVYRPSFSDKSVKLHHENI